MDGFHLDDTLLVPRGLRARKGAPETFDVHGLRAMLERVRANREPEIFVPIFDRNAELSRAGARSIAKQVRVVIVEGNYLLLRKGPWSNLAKVFDFTVMLDVPESILEKRLLARWTGLGLSSDEALAKINRNDLPNGRLVQFQSAKADFHVSMTL